MVLSDPLLTFARLTVHLRPDRSWRLPTNPEVMVRGALGRAFFEVACDRDDRVCDHCARTATCNIPSWWDPSRLGSHRLRPFTPRVLTRPRTRVGPDRSWQYMVVLVIPPTPDLTLLRQAIMRAAADGFGAERVPHRVERLVGGETRSVPGAPHGVTGAKLHFVTPWRSTRRGAHPPDFSSIVRASIARIRAIERHQNRSAGPRWALPEGCLGRWNRVRWVRRKVHSTNRSAMLDLSGFTGTFSIGPEVAPWVDLLAAVAAVNIGTQTSYGLGRLEIDWETDE